MARLLLERKARPEFLRQKLANIPVAGTTFQLPADMLELRSVTLWTPTGKVPLKERSKDYVTTTLSASHYYREGFLGILGAAPDSGSTVTVDYYHSASDLVSDTDTNEWSLNAYDILLYATLSVAANFLHEPESEQNYLQHAYTLLSDLRMQDIAREESGVERRMGEDA